MAFIRRHRMVLVPLFVAVVVGAGAVLLLRGESDEPGDGQPSDPVVTVQPWEELAGLRNDHTREWRVVTEVEYVDPETEETIVRETVSRVREVGSNLCYQDAEGDWQPSVTEWQSTDTGFKADRNNYCIYFGSALGSGYTKVVSSEQFWMRPRYLILGDGVRSTVLAQIDANATGQIDRNDPSKLVFADAFGEALDADIEYVLERASFHQNVVLHEAIALPDGFNASTTQLYVYTELGLDTALADPRVSVQCGGEDVVAGFDGNLTPLSTDTPIAFRRTSEGGSGAREKEDLFSFGESRVYDSAAGTHNETEAERCLWRHPVDRTVYLVERVPHGWLADATYPVVLDYTTKSGSINSEVWYADATYYVSGDVNIASGETLTIEPGTVVKFHDGTALNATSSGSKIVAKGEPFQYIVFTSEDDDETGATITPYSDGYPNPGDYDDAIKIGASASSECVIEYCKIGYASDGIEVDLDIGTIAHCIIRDCGDGIVTTASTATGAPDLFNCLIADITAYGVIVGADNVTFTFEVTNCTLDACSSAAVNTLSGQYGTVNLTANNNLFTNNNYGVLKAGNGTVTLDYNGWDGNTTDVSGTSNGAHAQDSLPGSPYETHAAITALGEYFIDLDGNGENLEDTGSATFSSLYGTDAQFDVAAPELVDADIDGSATWSKRSVDSGTVDIGYHHPRIDVLLSGDRACGSGDVLTISPGAVVAFAESARLLTTGSAELHCDGDPDDYIQLAGKRTASMGIEAPTHSDWNSRMVHAYQFSEATFTYTRFLGAEDYALKIDQDMTTSDRRVAHCIFQNCRHGIWINPCDVTLSNVLFDHCHSNGIYTTLNSGTYDIDIRNCTFNRGYRGLRIVDGEDTAYVVKDCLFTDCYDGFYIGDAPGEGVEPELDHNAYYDCNYEVHLGYEGSSPSKGPNSFTLTEDPYDATWSSWHDQWYLDQDGDCVDAGSRHVVPADLQYHTTTPDTDTVFDVNTVDIGYHYPTTLSVSSSHFDNSPSGSITIAYIFSSALTNRKISIYNSDGDLVYQTTQAASDDEISLTWDGKGNQASYNGQTLDSGAYTVVVTGGAGDDEYAAFLVWIEQSGALTITRPTSNSTVEWY